MRITGYKNDNGWSAERGNNSDLFFLNGPDNESKALVPESFFAGSDWVAVKEEEWAKGEWVYVKDGSLEELFRLGCIAGDNIYEGGEYYLLVNGEYRAPQNPTLKLVCDKKEASKATYDQIERIFKAVLQHKGYVHGIKIKSFEGHNIRLSNPVFVYDSCHDCVYVNLNEIDTVDVYKRGQFAEILEEPKKEVSMEEAIQSGNTESDWRTKPVFSYEELLSMEAHVMVSMRGEKTLVIDQFELESEAKRRTV